MSGQDSQANALHIGDSALDPISRISETLFGLIMVLSFTCSLSVATAGREDIHEMLIGALGCNLAWGIIDAFFYLMTVAGERGREYALFEKLRRCEDITKARALVRPLVPELFLGSLTDQGADEIREHILKKYPASPPPLLSISDLRAALVVFGIVFLSTFPPTIPFIVMQDTVTALRVSNAVALVLLFGLGASLGKYAGRRPLTWGLGMVVIGSALVSMTIQLGG